MDFSQRIKRIKPSPTVSLNAAAKKMAASGRRVFNFTVGEPDSDTPESVIESAKSALSEGMTRYGPPGGTPQLRKAISAKLKEDNALSYDEDQIVIGVGAKQILFHLCLGLLNDGDEVIIPAPYWVSYPSQVAAAGAEAKVIPFNTESMSVDLDELERQISNKTKMVILNSPNNPSGYVWDENTLKRLGSILEKSDAWIVSDEIYEYLVYEGKHHSLLSICPSLKDRFIVVNGFSKGFSMTGWRVGYAAAPSEVAGLLKKLQSQSTTCLPTFIEKACLTALEKRTEITSNLKEAMTKKREFVLERLKSQSDLNWAPSQGAFYFFIDIRSYLEKCDFLPEKTSLAFGAYLLEKTGVAMVPGEAFGTPGFLRMSYATSLEELSSGLDLFFNTLPK